MLPAWIRIVRRRLTSPPIFHTIRTRSTRNTRLAAVELEERLTPAVPLVTSVFQNGVDTGGGVYTGTRDTYVRRDGANATTVRATAATVLVDWPDAGGTNDTQGLLRFNNVFGAGAGQIPLGAKIVNAFLSFNTPNPGDGGELHRMLIDWQDTVTWNTSTGGIYNAQPGLQADGVEAAAAFESTIGIATRDQDILGPFDSADVTRDLQAWSNGAANFGWAILPWNLGTDGWEFNQSENATIANRPKLTVHWVPASTSSISFRQGVNGYTGTVDTMLQQGSPDTAGGTLADLVVDATDSGANNERQVLLRFNNIFGAGANQIPVGSTILGATLRFETSGADSQGDGGHMNRMLTAWTDTATWNSLNNGVQTNDVEATSAYDSSVGSQSLTPNYTNWSPIVDVTDDVQAWSNGLANNGWALIPWIGGSDGWILKSSEFATASGRPQLTVFYGPPPPAPPPDTTLDIVAGALTVTGGSTTPNSNMTLSLTGGNYSINDAAAPITLTAAAVSAGWSGSGTNTVTGPDANVSSLTLDLNLGNDSFTLRGVNDPLTVTGGGQSGDALSLPDALTYIGTVSLTGFGTAAQAAGTTLTIGNLTIGANTVGSTGTNIRTAAGTVNVLGGSGGAFLTEVDGANVGFRATGSGQARITNLAGSLTIAAESASGTGGLILTSPDAIAVNAPIVSSGPITITANTDGAGTQGFSQGPLGAIVAGDASAQAFSLTVNGTSGGTGAAAINASIFTAPGGTITVNANQGTITCTAAGLLLSGGGGDSSTVRLNAAAIGTAANLVRTSTGNIRATGGTGGVFVSEHSDNPGTAQATAAGAGSIRLVAASATNNGMIIVGPVWTQTGNIALEADDDLIIEAGIGGSMNALNFAGTVTCLASLDLVNEQLFRQSEDPILGHSGFIATTNTSANAVSIQVSATTTGAGVGGGVILGHITTGPGGTITVNAQAGTSATRAGRILMTPGGLLDTGPTGRVVLQARDNSIGEAISPILITAGTVTATTNSTDPATSLAPLQLPGSIYVTTTGPASFAATTTTAAANIGEILLTTQSGVLTINGATRTDSGQITLNGAGGVALSAAIGGTGESGDIVISAGSGTINQTAGQIVTTGGLLLTGGAATLNQAANNATTIAANLTGALSIADANVLATGTVAGTTSITATGTTVTGGRLNVVSNVTGPVTAAANGTVGGTGTITGALTANANGKVSPGTTPGRVTVNGNVTFASGSTFEVEINGATVATQYDQLTVNGTVNLGGATLAATLGAGFTPAVGTTFTIIDNDGTDAVNGTFAGLAPGAVFAISGQSFSISYNGGTGNDVVLTRSSAVAPAQVTSVVVNAGQANLSQRSIVTSVTVTFDRIVTFAGAAAAAFQLSRTGPGTPTGTVTFIVDTSGSTATQTVARLTTFSGPLADTATASLIDGNYALTVFGGQVQGGLQGGDNVSALHRLYGDINGDKAVNGLDLAVFRTAFGTTTGNPNFVTFLDQNGDGAINGLDLAEYRTRFGTTLP